jgi:predicted DNA-binding transcriptional regulator AlpA
LPSAVEDLNDTDIFLQLLGVVHFGVILNHYGTAIRSIQKGSLMHSKTQMDATSMAQTNPNSCITPADAPLFANQIDKALRILRMKQLVERTQLSRATLYVLIATDPTFPRKIKLTERTVGWIECEVDAWIMSRATA